MTTRKHQATPSLLPCPFCGEQPDVTPWHGGSSERTLIRCDLNGENPVDCPAEPSVVGETLLEAAEKWNTRHHDLFSTFDECLNLAPFLILEIGYNRMTDWMVHIYDCQGSGIKTAKKLHVSQSNEREEVMRDAALFLHNRFLSPA